MNLAFHERAFKLSGRLVSMREDYMSRARKAKAEGRDYGSYVKWARWKSQEYVQIIRLARSFQ